MKLVVDLVTGVNILPKKGVTAVTACMTAVTAVTGLNILQHNRMNMDPKLGVLS